MIRYFCTGCKQGYEARSHHAGRRCRCPGCGLVAVVPATSAADVAGGADITWKEPELLESEGSQQPARSSSAGLVCGLLVLAGAGFLIYWLWWSDTTDVPNQNTPAPVDASRPAAAPAPTPPALPALTPKPAAPVAAAPAPAAPVANAPAETRASHILVATQEEAARLREEILAAGGDRKAFSAAARKHSKDPATKTLGGDVGWFKGQGEFDAAFVAAAATLEVGAVSPPAQTSLGWHLILVTARRTAER